MSSRKAPVQENKTPSTKTAPTTEPCTGIAGGCKQAHSDFIAWFYQSHGSLFDSQMTNLDSNGVKREFVGYGLAGLVLLLLFTRFAPLVANLVCILYPILATLAVVRGQSSESSRWLIYWAIFGCFSLFDTHFGAFSLYWIFKILLCVFLYLPQTQGAVFVYGTVVEPLVNLVDEHILKKFA